LPVAEAGKLTYRDCGMLPTVWHFRSRFFSPMLVGAYNRFSPLRDNLLALTTLVVAAALFGWIRSMLEAQARVLLVGSGLDVAVRLRRSIHRQTLRLGPSDLEGHSGQQALHLFTTEVDRLSSGVYHWAERMGRDPLRLLLLVALIFAIDARL